MAVKILMPALSPTMTEGTLAHWLKKEGDKIESGDVLAEIETDKATMELEAVEEGTLAKIIVPEGTKGVAVKSLIAILKEEGDSEEDIAALLQKESPPSQKDTPKDKPIVVNKETKTEKTPMNETEAAQASTKNMPAEIMPEATTRLFITPLAKRFALDHGLNLEALQGIGTGPHGRIILADVEKFVKNEMTKAAKAPPSIEPPQPFKAPQNANEVEKQAALLGMAYEADPVNPIRNIIATKLQAAKQTIPHFYLNIECNIDALLTLRAQFNETLDGKKISINDFIIKAAALALQEVPAANASWAGDHVIRYRHSDISVAVASENGLITPIIHQAENKKLEVISDQMKTLALKARENKLKPQEFQGGSFTISNLGMFGIKSFSAIINPPQSCILAVGAGEKRAIVKDDKLTIATMMDCTLSVDHRSVDGAIGAEFLAAFKKLIEQPLRLILN